MWSLPPPSCWCTAEPELQRLMVLYPGRGTNGYASVLEGESEHINTNQLSLFSMSASQQACCSPLQDCANTSNVSMSGAYLIPLCRVVACVRIWKFGWENMCERDTEENECGSLSGGSHQISVHSDSGFTIEKGSFLHFCVRNGLSLCLLCETG